MNTQTQQFSYDGITFAVSLDASEGVIAPTIRKTGAWEENQLRLYPTLVTNAGVFVDVGANVGVNSIFLAKRIPGARVVAVEPDKRNIELLARNVSASGVNTISIAKMAIADHDGTIAFSGSGTNAKFSGPEATGETIQCVTLDTLYQDSGLEQVDLLKVDVEGFSDVVLAGANEALKATKNVILEFSIGDTQDRFQGDTQSVTDHFAKILERLKSEFRHIYHISRKDGLIQFQSSDDLIAMLTAEQNVGDVLATRVSRRGATTPLAFAFKRIAELQSENHRRITQINDLDSRPSFWARKR